VKHVFPSIVRLVLNLLGRLQFLRIAPLLWGSTKHPRNLQAGKWTIPFRLRPARLNGPPIAT
jgi:hypothetical protein